MLKTKERSVILGSDRQIVVIDDDDVVLMFTAKCLEVLGFSPVTFIDADSALAFLKRGDHRPRLILSDLNMPGMPLSDFVNEVRQIKYLSGVKIFVVSAADDLRMAAKQVGADGGLPKPFQLSDLKELIRSEDKNHPHA